ncbi:MAG TPA: hypothetical protein VI934_01550 [Candidatus Nanoarchaeia archaeon]|nr:hypothetical protein [Candidatus Nanoarchaeia archaeon]
MSKKIRLLIVFFVILLIAVTFSSCNFPTKQSALDSIFPSKTELPEGWSFKQEDVYEISPFDNHSEGKMVTYGIGWDPTIEEEIRNPNIKADIIVADLTVDKFSDSDTAKVAYDKIVSPLQWMANFSSVNNPYSEIKISIPNCYAFGMVSDEGQESVNSHCLKDDLVIHVNVFNSNNFGDPEESLKQFTGLLMR